MEQKAIKCMEIDQTLLYKQLPAHMIVTNFIAGEDDCNYEIYIREFINEGAGFDVYDIIKGSGYISSQCYFVISQKILTLRLIAL